MKVSMKVSMILQKELDENKELFDQIEIECSLLGLNYSYKINHSEIIFRVDDIIYAYIKKYGHSAKDFKTLDDYYASDRAYHAVYFENDKWNDIKYKNLSEALKTIREYMFRNNNF